MDFKKHLRIKYDIISTLQGNKVFQNKIVTNIPSVKMMINRKNITNFKLTHNTSLD